MIRVAPQSRPPCARASRRRTFACVLTLVRGVLAAAAGTRTAAAQGSIALRWNACDSLGDQQIAPVCGVNDGESRLVLTLRPDTSVTQVVGWALVLDVVTTTKPMPSWWMLQPGGCRQGQLVADLPNGTEGSCADSWSALGGALVQSVIYPRPGGDTSQLRVVVGVSVPLANAVTLAANTPSLAAVLGLRYANTAGTGACTGCSTPACLVFNSAELVRAPGAPGNASVWLVTPLAGIGSQALWGAGANCTAVPVRNRTWGSIKALYR